MSLQPTTVTLSIRSYGLQRMVRQLEGQVMIACDPLCDLYVVDVRAVRRMDECHVNVRIDRTAIKLLCW